MRLDSRQFGFLLAITCSVMAAPVTGHSSRSPIPPTITVIHPAAKLMGRSTSSRSSEPASPQYLPCMSPGSHPLQPNVYCYSVGQPAISCEAAGRAVCMHLIRFGPCPLLSCAPLPPVRSATAVTNLPR